MPSLLILSRWRRGLLVLGLLMLAQNGRPVQAEPYTPQREDELVERLPLRLGSAAERAQARTLQARLRQDPHSLPLALALARAAIARARLLGDPRELGQAQAVLAPWWQDTTGAAPPAVRLLRASIRQSQHEFAPALADLEGLLTTAGVPLPLQAQAELTRAAVLQVMGRWREAGAGCERLAGPHYASLGPAVPLHGQVCLAELDSLQGRGPAAEAALARLARQPAAQPAATQAWIALLRGELAERRQSGEAEALFKQALQAAPDLYTRAAYADVLLARRRWADAAALLLTQEGARADGIPGLPDALLLRLAIAWQGARDPRAAAAVADLQARFEAAQTRGDGSHGRERARFALDVQGDALTALAQAQANWALQKEPADALLLARAALAAGQPAAAEPVRRFRRETGFADRRLAEVLP